MTDEPSSLKPTC